MKRTTVETHANAAALTFEPMIRFWWFINESCRIWAQLSNGTKGTFVCVRTLAWNWKMANIWSKISACNHIGPCSFTRPILMIFISKFLFRQWLPHSCYFMIYSHKNSEIWMFGHFASFESWNGLIWTTKCVVWTEIKFISFLLLIQTKKKTWYSSSCGSEIPRIRIFVDFTNNFSFLKG